MARTPHLLAFTLIEIMLVVAILVIALSFSYPAIRDAVHRAPMTQAVKDVMDACRHARSQAILSGHPMELRIYPKELRIEVATVANDEEAGSSTGGAPLPGTESSDSGSGSGTGSIHTPPSPFISSATLSDEIRIEMLDVNFTECKDFDVARVRFYPNGTCDDMTLVLHSDMDYRKISLEVVTSLAQVETDVNNFTAN